MLVLSRKVGERLWIGEHVAVTIVKCGSGGVRLGIEAPDGISIKREEVKQRDACPEDLYGRFPYVDIQGERIRVTTQQSA